MRTSPKREPAKRKDDYTPQEEIPRQHPGALDLLGEIKSIAYRYRLKQLDKAIDMERQVVATHTELLHAQEAWRVARVRIEPDSLEAIKETERMRMRVEKAKTRHEEAKALRELETFQKRTEIEDEVLEAEKYEAKLRAKRARAAFEGTSVSAEAAAGAKNLEEELMEIADQLGALERQRNELLNADQANESEVAAVDGKISRLLRRKEAAEENLAAQ